MPGSWAFRLGLFYGRPRETRKGFNFQTINNYMEKKNNHGGARPGAGRPKGSTALITARTLVDAIEQHSRKPFEQLVAEGYQKTIDENNNKMRLEYERMILGKVVSDRVAVDVTNTEEVVAAKQLSFDEALASLRALGTRQ